MTQSFILKISSLFLFMLTAITAFVLFAFTMSWQFLVVSIVTQTVSKIIINNKEMIEFVEERVDNKSVKYNKSDWYNKRAWFFLIVSWVVYLSVSLFVPLSFIGGLSLVVMVEIISFLISKQLRAHVDKELEEK